MASAFLFTLSAFYNENDPKAAAWLRELIKAGLIAPGIVDERSISDISPTELNGFTQCHFFAGIGGWSCALRLAGIADSVPVWTGSCPCQPFSNAGQKKGTQDSRHLWPSFARLIDARHPAIVFGEQVASADGREWLAGIYADLEEMGYWPAGADLCAASVKAPNPRQRLWWVAYSARYGWGQRSAIGRGGLSGSEAPEVWNGSLHSGEAGGMADADLPGCNERARGGEQSLCDENGRACGLGHANGAGSQPGRQAAETNGHGRSALADGNAGYWDAFDILECSDGKSRRIEPGSFPLAHGVSSRMVKLRGFGNAINPWVAKEFIEAAINPATGGMSEG